MENNINNNNILTASSRKLHNEFYRWAGAIYDLHNYLRNNPHIRLSYVATKRAIAIA